MFHFKVRRRSHQASHGVTTPASRQTSRTQVVPLCAFGASRRRRNPQRHSNARAALYHFRRNRGLWPRGRSRMPPVSPPGEGRPCEPAAARQPLRRRPIPMPPVGPTLDRRAGQALQRAGPSSHQAAGRQDVPARRWNHPACLCRLRELRANLVDRPGAAARSNVEADLGPGRPMQPPRLPRLRAGADHGLLRRRRPQLEAHDHGFRMSAQPPGAPNPGAIHPAPCGR